VRARDLDVARAVADRNLKGTTEDQGPPLQIVRMALLQAAKANAEEKVKITIGDLDRQIRFDRFLSDEPDSRTEHVIGNLTGKTREEFVQSSRRKLKSQVTSHSNEAKFERDPVNDSALHIIERKTFRINAKAFPCLGQAKQRDPMSSAG